MSTRDLESEAIAIAKLVKVIRQEIFDWNPFNFSGSFLSPFCTYYSENAYLYVA